MTPEPHTVDIVLQVADWSPPEPARHPMGSYIQGVQVPVSGHKGVTVACVHVAVPMGDFVDGAQNTLSAVFIGVGRRQPGEVDNPRVGRKVAICDALDQAYRALGPQVKALSAARDRAEREAAARGGGIHGPGCDC